MRRVVGKRYPLYTETYFESGENNPWLNSAWLPDIPQRFQNVYHRRGMGDISENFITFDSEVHFPEDTRHCVQDAYFMYDQEVILDHRFQLRGPVYDGDVDFFLLGPVTMRSGNPATDPQTHRSVRYPFKVATYYPIRNVLVIKGLTNTNPNYNDSAQDVEPHESVVRLIKWIFDKIETIGYKYNTRGEALLIGCDPEFNVHDIMDERIHANQLFSTDPEAQIGCDGHSQTGELRPEPADCPLKLTDHIGELMFEIANTIGDDKKVTTGGGGNVDPLGHHLHFNKMVSNEELELLDLFVGAPALKIRGAKRMTTEFEALGHGAIRRQPHGCEYRTPASSLVPELTKALHTTAYCVIRKWESLPEGAEFEFDTDDNTSIPTLESYLELDTSPDGKYKEHLGEYWKWVNGVDGREIDPKRDCLQWWVPGREEVKPQPGLKINWSSNIMPSSDKQRFIPMPTLEKIYDLSVFVLPTNDSAGEKTLQVCIDAGDKEKVDMAALAALKTEFGIDKILGFDHPSRKLGFTQAMLDELGNYRTLKSLVTKLAKVICV
ncbi:MAG: putative amidoligase domain-containing protein [Candidatus Thorarchaeota archaeon]